MRGRLQGRRRGERVETRQHFERAAEEMDELNTDNGRVAIDP